jgi:hypothetical protein
MASLTTPTTDSQHRSEIDSRRTEHSVTYLVGLPLCKQLRQRIYTLEKSDLFNSNPYKPGMGIVEHVFGLQTDMLEQCDIVTTRMMYTALMLGYPRTQFSGSDFRTWLTGTSVTDSTDSWLSESPMRTELLQRMRKTKEYLDKYCGVGVVSLPWCGSWMRPTMFKIWKHTTSKPMLGTGYVIDVLMFVVVVAYVQSYSVCYGNDAINAGILKQFLYTNLNESNPYLQKCVDMFVSTIDMWKQTHYDVMTIARIVTGNMLLCGNVLCHDHMDRLDYNMTTDARITTYDMIMHGDVFCRSKLAKLDSMGGLDLFKYIQQQSLHLIPEFKEHCKEAVASPPEHDDSCDGSESKEHCKEAVASPPEHDDVKYVSDDDGLTIRHHVCWECGYGTITHATKNKCDDCYNKCSDGLGCMSDVALKRMSEWSGFV